MAVLCRPATAVAVVCAGAYLLWVDRRRCALYVLGGLPFLVILAAYNTYYFGNPLVFGQSVVSQSLALRDTGSASLWQSVWRESLPGLLISPARGLVWFSPVLLFGFASAVAVWREQRYRALIPLQAAVVLMILVAGKWFDWWGGSTWGYRSNRRHHPVPGAADAPRCRAGPCRPLDAGAVRHLAAVVGRRPVRRLLQLQPGRLDRAVARARQPGSRQPLAVAATTDRLSRGQLRSGASAKEGGDGVIHERPETDSDPARSAAGFAAAGRGRASSQRTERPSQAS